MPTENQNMFEYITNLSILGLTSSATKSQVKQAYHNKVLLYHPDKGGSSEKFIEVHKAYAYIKFFQAQKEQRALSQKKKENPITVLRTKNSSYKIEITLKDAYYGKSKKVTLKRNRICSLCKGNGAMNDNDIINCAMCNGSGYISLNKKCLDCNGEGKIYRSRCPECKGNKVTLQSKEVELKINRGAYTGCKIIFEKESEEYPDFIPGDVIFEIIVQDDPKFKRIGSDLFMNYNISLVDCLTGGDIKINLFDRSILSSKICGVVQQGEMRRIKGKGMPFYDDSTKQGDIVLKFNIVLPKKIDERQAKLIKMALCNQSNKGNKVCNNKNFNLAKKKANVSNNNVVNVMLSEYKENEANNKYTIN